MSIRHKTLKEKNGNQDSIKVMTEEIELAIKEPKSNKEVRRGNFNSELLMTLEKTGKKVLFNLITEAYEIEKVPEDFERCMTILIQ